MRAIAVDDEPLALAQLERYAGRIPDLDLVATCMSARKAVEMMEKEKVDLVFLDVEMPGCSGIELAESLRHRDPYVIFITAYSKYAVDGFRVEAADYLLKPLSFSEFERGVAKVREAMRLKALDEGETSESIFVKAEGQMHSIKICDIAFIKGMGEYVQIKVAGRTKPLTTLQSLKYFESKLPASLFMRIHKSYLVNLSMIQNADTREVRVLGQAIPVGDKYRKALKSYLASS